MHFNSSTPQRRSTSPTKRSPSKRRAKDHPQNEQDTLAQDALAHIKAMEEAVEKHRQEGNAFYARSKRSLTVSSERPVGTESPHSFPAVPSDMAKTTEQVLPTPMTTMSQFLPSGSDTLQSKSSSSPKKVSFGLLKLVPEGKETSQPTHRQLIDGKNERKLLEMMGQEPTTPVSGTSEDEFSLVPLPTVTKTVFVEKGKTSKKKFFGMNISIPKIKPYGLTVSSEPTTPDGRLPPPKAAQLLGTSSNTSLRRSNSRARAYRVDTTVPLPPNLPHSKSSTSVAAGHSSLSGRNKAGGNKRVASDGSQAVSGKSHNARSGGLPAGSTPVASLRRSNSLHYLDYDIPPTPPAKNTPPKVERAGSGAGGDKSDAVRTATSESSEQRETMIIGDGRLSPTKTGSYGYKEDVNLVEKVPSISSIHGIVEGESKSAGYNPVKSNVAAPREGHWSEGQLQMWKEKAHISHPQLQPTFYTPSLYSVVSDMPGFRGSQNRDQSIYTLPVSRKHVDLNIHDRSPSKEVPLVFQHESDNMHVPSGSAAAEEHLRHSESDLLKMSMPHPTSNRGLDSSSANNKQPDAPIRRDSGPTEAVPKLNENNSLRTALGLGLTPLLSEALDSPNRQFPPNMSPYHARHPSALPTPLYAHHSPAMSQSGCVSPTSFVPPDGNDLITHFDILNRHVQTATNSLHAAIAGAHDDTNKTIAREHEQSTKVMSENFSDVKMQLNAVEHNVGRTTGEIKAANEKLDKLGQSVQTELVDRLEKLTATNTELVAKVDALTTRIHELEKRQQQQPQQQQYHPGVIYGPQAVWASPSMPLTQYQVQQMDRDARRDYSTAYGRQLAQPDVMAQHPMNGVSGHYAEVRGVPVHDRLYQPSGGAFDGRPASSMAS